MKRVIKFSLVFILFIAIYFISCKKEYSCENCKGKKPPIPNAGTDQTIVLPKDSVTLDGTASTDPDGTIVSYKWIKISGPLSSNILKTDSSKTLVKTLVMGVYNFELTVTDNGGLSAKDTVPIIVNDPAQMNRPPIANAGADQIITLPNNAVTLDGSGSTDPDNNITNYAWTNISGPSSFNITYVNAVQTQVTNLMQGTYQFELKVTDAGGLFSKDTIQVTVNNVFNTGTCDISSRPLVNAQLIPLGRLSQTRQGIAIASAGNKILFAGGANGYDLSSTVDIYDITGQTWLTAKLSVPRYAIAVATAGNKIFFAGGYNGDDTNPITYSTVDIYDASTNTWSVTSMSESGGSRSATVLNNKIFIAGGDHCNGLSTFIDFPATIDIYDVLSNTWSNDRLAEGRFGLSATAINNKIYFAGGQINIPITTNKIDIYDGNNATWLPGTLGQSRGNMASIAVEDKIYWAGGITEYSYTYPLSATVEIRDVNTQASSFACLFQPNAWFDAVLKNNKIIFFTGKEWVRNAKNKFDIYDVSTNTWSIGVLNQDISGAAIISVNNTIYVAGGYVNGVPSNQVWKLDF